MDYYAIVRKTSEQATVLTKDGHFSRFVNDAALFPEPQAKAMRLIPEDEYYYVRMPFLKGSIFGAYLIPVKHSPYIEEKDDPYELGATVFCPFCGSVGIYGDMFMIDGVTICMKCEKEARKMVMEDHDRDIKRFAQTDYQPFGLYLSEDSEQIIYKRRNK